jgi:glycosyltransferase involved in cell wall biosynthesis
MVRSSAVDSLIDAVGSLVSRGYGLQLFILAGGPLEGALRRHVRVRQLSGHVTFASEMADPTLAMAGADIFIRPSADTAFTADSLQALAAGMAVVSLPNSAADHLRPGETAFVCSQNTTEALAATIESVLRDRSDAQRLAAAGMDYVRRHHGVSAMAERTAAAYRKLLLARTTFAMQG